MILALKNWSIFLSDLRSREIYSIPARLVGNKAGFLVLKHDVETNVRRALKFARIEAHYGHSGTYYFQGYLLRSKKNRAMIRQIQNLGHEVSYHHDVMDSNNGNLDDAIFEFDDYLNQFASMGISIETVCQHGNPLKTRSGYTSNRDFFRNNSIVKRYFNIDEIMVNFKGKREVEYMYFSDAGFGFKLIENPETDDLLNSVSPERHVENFNELLSIIVENNVMLSVHTHRWHSSPFIAVARKEIFKVLKKIGTLIFKIPVFQRVLNKFYFIMKYI